MFRQILIKKNCIKYFKYTFLSLLDTIVLDIYKTDKKSKKNPYIIPD